MKVLCCGPEASGTQLLARTVANMGVEAVHRSIPHARRWDGLWDDSFDAAIVIVRDFWPAAHGQRRAGHSRSMEEAHDKLRRAVGMLGMLPMRWWLVTYENLITRPAEVVAEIAAFLGVEPGPFEEVRDENAKWYG